MVSMGRVPLRRIGDRQAQVLDTVSREGDVKVVDLARRLHVSAVTIRTDVESLAEAGMVRHVHGHIQRLPISDAAGRMAINYRAKARLCRRAVQLVPERSVIMIGGGSTCALFARDLSLWRKALYVVTNSVLVADALRAATSFEVTLLGGSFMPSQQANVGPLVKLCLSEIEADAIFLSASGWDESRGFMCDDLFCAEALCEMTRRSKRCVMLADSSKFGKKGSVPLNLDSGGLDVVSDSQLESSAIEALKRCGATVMIG